MCFPSGESRGSPTKAIEKMSSALRGGRAAGMVMRPPKPWNEGQEPIENITAAWDRGRPGPPPQVLAIMRPGRGSAKENGQMIVGVPKEIKADEHRVALLPVGAEELVGK